MEKSTPIMVSDHVNEAPVAESLDEKKVDATVKELAVTPSEKQSMPGYGFPRSSPPRRVRRKTKPLFFDRVEAGFRPIPRAVKAFLGVLVTGIPFMIFMLVARFALKGQQLGYNTSYFKLSLYLTILWATLLGIFAIAEGLARITAALCRMSTRSAKFAPLGNSVAFRITMLVWTGVSYAVNCSLWEVNGATINDNYKDFPNTFRQIFLFLNISFAVLLVQGIVLQLIAIRYVEGFVGPRSKAASNELETIRDLNSLVKRHITMDDPSFVKKWLKRAFYPVEDTMFDNIIKGRATEAEHREYAASLWETITHDSKKEVITHEDIADRLVQMGRDPEVGEDLFAQLDTSMDGEVSKEELECLVVETGKQLNARAESMRNIKQLLRKLELLLTMIVFGVIVFIYTNFFNQDWAKDSKSLWTGITGLGFAINGTITEFVGSCVFVFAKHAYDVGDIVECKGKKMMVKDIHLTHTNFQELREDEKATATNIVCQISHASLAGEAITNWTRSNDLILAKKKEEEAATS